MAGERRHDITRIESFSDAVFGFTLTLLVVSLDVPRSYDELMGIMGRVPVVRVLLRARRVRGTERKALEADLAVV